MTDPLYSSSPAASDDPTTPTDAPIAPPTTPAATDATIDATSPGIPSSTSRPANEPLTPLYAAAGLAEVFMTELRSRISQAQAQAKGLPAGKGRIADLQQQLKTYRDRVALGYNDLATRGKPTVDSTLVTVRHLSGRAERKVDDLRDAAAPTAADESTPVDEAPPVVVTPVVVVETTDTERSPGAAS